MKPRNFATNILLVILCVVQIIMTILAKEIHPLLLLIGVVGILILFPDWFLKVKHRAGYIVYKSLAIVLFLALAIVSGGLGFIFSLVFGVAEGLAESCGATTSHTELDKAVANFCVFLVFPFVVKIAMIITDLAVYRKDRRKLLEKSEEKE